MLVRFDPFRDIDRMRYCGMDGKINGSLTVVRGRKTTCTVDRLFIEAGPSQEEIQKDLYWCLYFMFLLPIQPDWAKTSCS